MKKINLFNRNTNLPSYRRKPVSGGFNCNGEIPRFRGMTGKARGVAECKFPSREGQSRAVAFCRGGWRVAPAGVWFAVIAAILIATPSFATPTELDKKTVASKAYVDTKQDIINTSMLETWGYTLPSLVTYDSTDGGLTGTKFGVLRQSDLDSDETLLLDCIDGAECEEILPTARAVAEALQNLLEYTEWTPLVWDNNTLPAAINAYSVTFNGTTNNWPYNQQNYLVRADTFVNSLALKQNKIAAGTAGNVVTYTGTAGTVGSVAVSSTEDYNQQNELTNGSNLANVQLVSTKQNKMTCAGWDSDTHTDEHCWLWSIE